MTLQEILESVKSGSVSVEEAERILKKESYEEMLSKLQTILNNLENNELNLEDSMKSYEEGVKLVNKIYKTLNTYEGKISVVKDEREVEFSERDGD